MPLLLAALPVLGMIVGAFITAVIPKKGTTENAFIDQVQEQLARQDDRTDKLDARVTTLETQVRLRDMYIAKLRDHIYRGKEPPPPDPPEGLT